MDGNWIKNWDVLATTPNRKIALEIIESGLDAINTENVITASIALKDNTLTVQGVDFDLSKFKKIKVVGFGKSSCQAALALEKILGDKITAGAVVGLEKVECKYIETFTGTHPRPTEANIVAGKKIYETIKDSTEENLIIVLVSGGGSALLCYPESEYIQGAKLYDEFLKTGGTISEMNTIRKHLSLLKGGGLAKAAYPATVVGLIFSDVPGDAFQNVASGATYKDTTTVANVEKIITANNLGKFDLIETPKEDKYFEKVHNFVLVSNKTAVEAMAKKAGELNLETNIISTELYDEVDQSLEKIFNFAGEGFSQVLGSPGPYPGQTIPKPFTGSISLAAGEPRVVVPKNAGKGGRNLHMGLEAVKMNLVQDDSVFISFGSDGMDNSDAAGAIVDKSTMEKVAKLGLDVNDYATRFDSYNFFQKTGDIIMTGPTGANVSDLMILLTKK
jgi:glycerate-2-kinase